MLPNHYIHGNMLIRAHSTATRHLDPACLLLAAEETKLHSSGMFLIIDGMFCL
jgi:hypothetical protein